MKLVTAEQMRRIDRVTIEERGIPGIELMRRAGKAVAKAAIELYESDSVAIITGKGNNAGDGFVAARELHVRGVAVTVFLLESPDQLSGDAALAYADFNELLWDENGEEESGLPSSAATETAPREILIEDPLELAARL